MKSNFDLIGWSMRNYRIVFLVVVLLTVFGVYGLVKMAKQEFPEYTIREGVIVAVYPGASAEEITEQVAKPLERFLFTYGEVRRDKTVSTSKNGLCYVKITLNDDVSNKDEVWSKIKHGINSFKMQLPSGVLAVIVKDDFGDVSALLIAVESDKRSYRELHDYTDALSDRLRTIASVSNVQTYGEQKEQITIYLDRSKLAAYGIGDKVLTTTLVAQGLTVTGGKIKNSDLSAPIHVEQPMNSEQEVADRIVYADKTGAVVRIRDIARVVREYPEPDSYVSYNGHNCLVLSLEMREGYNIVQYGEEVDEVLAEFAADELPEDVSVSRIADQAKVVRISVYSFMRDLLISMAIIIVVMMILFPIRSAIVAATTIPLSTFISIGLMYIFGIPLNIVTLAALIIVLGMVVDNAIVVIDGYLENLNAGHSRWYSAAVSARKYFASMMLSTICVSAIFFPLLLTMTGMWGDFIRFFPWTILINLMMSLLLAVTVVPYLEVLLIKRKAVDADHKPKKTIVDYVQNSYIVVLRWTFRHGWTTILLGLLSIVLSVLMALRLNVRMMPIAERDQFAVEISLPDGTPIERTAMVADSVRNMLARDSRVESVTEFVGSSSPRFQASYAPKMASVSYAQFIVNTTSNGVTDKILDDYTDCVADMFPQAYVKFKQLDYQSYPTVEYRFSGNNIDSIIVAARMTEEVLRQVPDLVRVTDDYALTRPVVNVDLNAVTASQLGIAKANAAANIAMATDGLNVGTMWENDYGMPVVIKNDESRNEQTIEALGDTYIATMVGSSVPLRQIATTQTVYDHTAIVRRNGIPTISVTAELKRGAIPARVAAHCKRLVEKEVLPYIPSGVGFTVGGEDENNSELLPPIFSGILIALIIIFFFILFNFKKFGITVVALGSSVFLCLFGAVFGLWVSGITVGLTTVFGFITLLGMIMKNVILMYQHAEDKRKYEHYSVRGAAYDAGRRRMVPIFLTTATTAVGVVPMIIAGSSFWCPVGVSIFAGGIWALIAVVTILPVLYWKLYK